MPASPANKSSSRKIWFWERPEKALQEALTAADALNRLLDETGLFAEHTATGAVMIRRKRQASAQPLDTPDKSGPTPEALDEVVVTGLIHSLRTNLDIKRNAGGSGGRHHLRRYG